MAQVVLPGDTPPGTPRPKYPPYVPPKPAPKPPAPPRSTYPSPATPPPAYPPYSGGGGGGGYTPPAPPDPNAFAGLPTQYVAGLRQFVGDPTTYYSTRGAEKQAQTDYYSMLNNWQNNAGVALTPDDWANVWAGLNAYRTGYTRPGLERAWTFSDALGYMNRMLARAPQAPMVSYLQTGEI